uniref:RNB domain-containing protein n=1 Tax=Dendroctonus ponderosae TaxID=77166 RepID=A0AAR5PJJ9_DENPD
MHVPHVHHYIAPQSKRNRRRKRKSKNKPDEQVRSSSPRSINSTSPESVTHSSFSESQSSTSFQALNGTEETSPTNLLGVQGASCSVLSENISPALSQSLDVRQEMPDLNPLCLQDTSPNTSPNANQPSTSTQSSDSLETVPKSREADQKGEPVVDAGSVTFSIHAVKNSQTGRFFKVRNKTHKFINLKSFLADQSQTCVFETNLGSLSASLEALNLESGYQKKRKYYDSVDVTSNSEDNTDTTEQNTRNESFTDEVQKSPTQKQDIPFKSKETRRRVGRKEYKRQQMLKKAAKLRDETFPETLTAESAEEGEKSSDLVRGFIRINQKNPRDSFVSHADSTQADYYIRSVADRNKALDGDEVLLKLKEDTELCEGKRVAVVVYISKKIHPRITVGNLQMTTLSDHALFIPRDKRMPNMLIPDTTWPIGFKDHVKDYKDVLFVAKLVRWLKPNRAIGFITETLGRSGDLQVETMAILKEFALDITPFSPEMIQHLPKTKDIAAEELEYREDIRKECVFTIDPLTARDLDDAVSAKKLPNGHYEIGVHISDASYYLHEGTPLDEMVSSKATTIYLVDSVYHMLPVELCLHCSLLPGDDKLAFSVFWEMDEQGQIYNTRFVRTILNSCAKLAYEHAQQMIEDPTRKFKKEELPNIMHGFTPEDLSTTVNILKKIATNLREARVQNGSLRVEQVKLLFSVHPQSGEPLDFINYENKESHRLIEEFMLLANISVAQKIHESFPDVAFLRCHEEPKMKMLRDAQLTLQTCGIHVDVSSSGGIQSSLNKYITSDFLGYCRGAVLNHLFAKTMTRARYFCSGTMGENDTTCHYALSVPIYTHFTSPIRRYADIMVHRLLAASLGYVDKPKWHLEHVAAIADTCNQKKYNAKRAGEASSDLYLAHYIANHQPSIMDCVVVDVKEKSFEAITLKTGSQIKVFQKFCQDNPHWTVEDIPVSDPSENSENHKKVFRLIIDFPATAGSPEPSRMVVEMFSVVKVNLIRIPNSYKLEPFLIRPVMTAVYMKNFTAPAESTNLDI